MTRRAAGEALSVGVVGAGTAGAAAAVLLGRAGHRVTLFEAVPEPVAVGAGILIQPTGLGALQRLGLADAVLSRGSRVTRLHCQTHARRDVLDLSYLDAGPDRFGLGLHRGVLFEALFGAARAEENVDVRCGVRVTEIERAGPERALLDAGGQRHGPFDLVVVADGARSALRDGSPLVRRAREYPWGALWFIAEDPVETFAGTLYQVVESTTTMLGFLPSGLGPSGDVPRVSLFWSVRGSEVDAWRKAGLKPWKRRVLELEPRAAPVLDQIREPEQVLFARYHDVVLRPWHEGGVVFLGDAAHATSPQLGQGANLALVDACVLADCLALHPSIDAALADYSRKRRAHLGYYQWATRFLTPFFQSDARALGWLRDAFMGLACRLPIAKGMMLRTLTGVQRGALRRALPLGATRGALPGANRA